MSTIPDIIARHVTPEMRERAERMADIFGCFYPGANIHRLADRKEAYLKYLAGLVAGYLAGQVLKQMDEHPLPSTESDRKEIEKALKGPTP